MKNKIKYFEELINQRFLTESYKNFALSKLGNISGTDLDVFFEETITEMYTLAEIRDFHRRNYYEA